MILPNRTGLPNLYGVRLLRDRRVLMVAVAVFLVVALGLRLIEFLIFKEGEPWGYDFSAYWYAGRSVLEGGPLYADFQLDGSYAPQGRHLYIYPPFLAVVVAPLTSLFTSFREAQAAWALLGFATLMAALSALVVSRRGIHGPTLFTIAAATLAFPPVVSELINGNVHLFLLGLFALAWLVVQRQSAAGDFAAGAAIGIAAVIKIFPAIVLVWFVMTGRWRALGGALVAVLAAVVITLPVVGVEPWLAYPTVLLNLGRSTDTTDTLAPTAWLSEVMDFAAARSIVSIAGLLVLAWSALRLRASLSFAVAVWVSVLIAPAVYHHYLALATLPLLLGYLHGASRLGLLAAYLLMFGGEQPLLGNLDWLTNRALPSVGAVTLLIALIRFPIELPKAEEVADGRSSQAGDDSSLAQVRSASRRRSKSVTTAGLRDRLP